MEVDGKVVNSGTTATDIGLNPVVTIIFSQDMAVTTLKSANKLTLKQGTIAKALTIEQGTNNKTITIIPTSQLVNSTTYTLTIAKDLTVKIGEKTYKLSTDAVFKFTTIATTITNTYTVMFNVDGGSAVASLENIAQNTSITKPTDPTKANYTFVNWFKDSGKTMVFNFSSETIIANITLYAKWEIITYTVTFNLNYTDSVPIVRTVNSGTTATKETPTRTNYNFVDWFENEDLTGTLFDFTTEISADKTLYAKWEIITYTITFNLNYTDSVPITQTVNSGMTATRATPTRTNYNFVDWFENENLTGTPFAFTTEIRADKTLYAKWEIITYTVTFDLNYTPSTPITQTVNIGTTATRETPIRTNYNFVDWYETDSPSDTDVSFDFSTKIRADKTLYAKWTSNPVVTFNTLGGSVIAPQIIEGGTLNAPNPAPTRTSYTLEGWYENEQLTGNKVIFPKTISTNIILYAKWTRIVYTITFDLDYDNAPSGGTEDTNQEGKVTKTNPVRGTGYTFISWGLDRNIFNSKIDLNTHVFDAPITLYALWRFLEIYFDSNYLNSPSVPVRPNQEGKISINDDVPLAQKSRSGYALVGWFTEPTGGAKIDLDTYVFKAGITLYARWKLVYRVTFDLNYNNAPSGGTADSNGEGKVTKADPTRTGYIFNGWFTADAGGTKVELTEKVFDAPITLYAQWTQQYTVTFDLNYDSAPEGGTADSNQESKVSKADPTRPNYTFNGWFTADAGGTKVELTEKAFDAPITLYAQWTREIYRVTFDLNYNAAPRGGTADSNQEGRVIKVAPVRTRYTFNGWFTEARGGTEINLGSHVFDSATTLYAQWTRVAYRVTFNLNYENAPDGGTVDSNQEDKVIKTDPSRGTGYTFSGWFTEARGGREINLGTHVFDSATTLYARWQFSISFNENHSGTTVSSVGINPTTGKVTKANPTRSGYTFNGWFTEDIGGTKVELTMKVFDSATTLYAQWIVEGKANSLSVSVATVASSIQLSISSSLALSDIGAVIRLGTESAPTKTEATASVGYVSLTVPANEGRKFSISQHYGSDFTDGLTLADVLSPNTAYKLYLYFPANSISVATTEITGISLTNDVGEIAFTTASLPAEGDAIWTSQWAAKEFVSSLDNLYYMEEQTAVVVVYFKLPFNLFLGQVSTSNSRNNTYVTVGRYVGGSSIGTQTYFNYGTITGYSTSYNYWIVAEKELVIKTLKTTLISIAGNSISFFLPATRY